MTVSITLASPGDFDLKALAESTRASLELLEPWCRMQDSPETGPRKEIVTQALEYIRAINLSIAAAQAGFTVAVDIISFADIIPTSTVPERLAYLKGLSEMVNEARANAEETLRTFKDVHQKVYSLTEKAKEQMMDPRILSSDGYNTLRRSLEPAAELRNRIAVLERFTDHISNFIRWWDWMKIEPNTQQTQNDQSLTYYHASLNDKAVIMKWWEFKAQYTAYTDMIGLMQDAYPHLFHDSLKGLELQQPHRQKLQPGLAMPKEGAAALLEPSIAIPMRKASSMEPSVVPTTARSRPPSVAPTNEAAAATPQRGEPVKLSERAPQETPQTKTLPPEMFPPTGQERACCMCVIM